MSKSGESKVRLLECVNSGNIDQLNMNEVTKMKVLITTRS